MAKDLLNKYGKATGSASYRESRVRRAERVVFGVRVGGAVLVAGLIGLLYWWAPWAAIGIATAAGAIATADDQCLRLR